MGKARSKSNQQAQLSQLKSQYGFHTKKSLGQNFIFDEAILESIVLCAEIDENDAVLEIGPGAGSLTKKIAEHANRVISIEVDQQLREILNANLAHTDNVQIIYDDFMTMDLTQILPWCEGLRLKVVANIPYYITSAILMKLLESDLPLEGITIMVQKEVAARLCCQAGSSDRSILSVLTQLYSQPEVMMHLPASVFSPPPKVDSAVVNLVPRKELIVDTGMIPAFTAVVKAAFSQKRKQLINSLTAGLAVPREVVSQLLDRCQILSTSRAENLNDQQFACLAREWVEYRSQVSGPKDEIDDV